MEAEGGMRGRRGARYRRRPRIPFRTRRQRSPGFAARTISVLAERQELINSSRSGGSSLYAPLHQAAHGGAPREIILKLIGLGAWRTLQNVRGERPVDIAERRGHAALLDVLTPVL